jgi:Protein of unknown function (DUF3768)
MATTQSNAEKNCDLNDRFRSGDITIPGRIVMTSGVHALLQDDPLRSAALIVAIREFDAFDADNDPWHEHDFGAFAFDDKKLFWKIDAYAPDLEHGSEDPADLSRTVRVLTVMLAEEY